MKISLKNIMNNIKSQLKTLNEGVTIDCCLNDPSQPGNPVPIQISVPNLIACTDPSIQLLYPGYTVSAQQNEGCPVTVDPLGPSNVQDLEDDDTGHTSNTMDCDDCVNGQIVTYQFPINIAGCPAPMVPSGTTDPCDLVEDPCDFNFNGHCATTHDLAGRWASSNGPQTFLTNMQNGFNNNGCQFIQNRLTIHQGHQATGIYIGQNHPAPGTTMGPAWAIQKDSKVDFLVCILDTCCGAGNDDELPSDQPHMPQMKKAPGRSDGTKTRNPLNESKNIKERFKQLAGIKSLYEIKDEEDNADTDTDSNDGPSSSKPKKPTPKPPKTPKSSKSPKEPTKGKDKEEKNKKPPTTKQKCHTKNDFGGDGAGDKGKFNEPVWTKWFEQKVQDAPDPCNFIQIKEGKWQGTLTMIGNKHTPKCNPKWQNMLAFKQKFAHGLKGTHGCSGPPVTESIHRN